GLDRGRSDVAFFGKGPKDRLCEAEFVKLGQSKVFRWRPAASRKASGHETRGSRHPAWTGLSIKRKSENGAENRDARCAPRSSFTRPGGGLENQADVPTERYMAGRREHFNP